MALVAFHFHSVFPYPSTTMLRSTLVLFLVAAAAVVLLSPGTSAQFNGCICTADYSPVCGVDGRTYGNRCAAGCASVVSGDLMRATSDLRGQGHSKQFFFLCLSLSFPERGLHGRVSLLHLRLQRHLPAGVRRGRENLLQLLHGQVRGRVRGLRGPVPVPGFRLHLQRGLQAGVRHRRQDLLQLVRRRVRRGSRGLPGPVPV